MTASGSPAAGRLLLSRAARAELEPAIQRLAGGAGLELVTLEDVADDDTVTVDACFLSRDITGLSTKHVVLAELAACYRVLRRSPSLAWVHIHSAGADRPIYAELRRRQVAVTTSAGNNARVVAETALAGILALSRRFPQLMQAQHEWRWAPLVSGALPADLAGQRVVLVGWGAIARTLQPWLTMLGLHVTVVRRDAGSPAAPGVPTFGTPQLAACLPQAQWLVLACPLTEQTRRLIGAEQLALLPPEACLVNVSRGEVVVEAALITALQTGRLAGAFLDVFETEPLPTESPLWALPQVIVTPHCAGHAAGNAARVAQQFLDNLQRWLQAEPLLNQVAP